MSDERFRQVVRRALTPVVGEVGEGPSWDEIVDHPAAPARPPGPRFAVAAAAVVIAVIGITALVFGGGTTDTVTDPEPSDPTPTTETTLGPDSTEPSQTTTPPSAPIDGADTAGQLAPGWEAVGRLGAPRYHATTVDTGTELLVFGGGDDPYTGPGERGFSPIWSGIAIDHVSGTVRSLPPSPMCESGIPTGVWTGSEFMVWGAGASSADRDDCPDAAAYTPASDSWRTLDSEFFAVAGSQTRWAGDELVSASAGLAYRVSDGNVRTIDSVRDSEMFTGSDVHSPPTMHSTGEEILALGSEGVIRLDLASGQAVDGPGPPIPDRARSSSWTGSELLAVNYDMEAATFAPAEGRWTEAPSIPLRFYECGPVAVAGGGLAFVVSCSGIGLWDGSGDWKTLPLPAFHDGVFGTFAVGDGYLYQIGENVLRYLIPDSVDGETRQPEFFPIGVQFFDTPAEWTVVGSFHRTGSDPFAQVSVGVNLSGPGDVRCRVASTYGGRYIPSPTAAAELTRSRDGVTIPVGQIEDGRNGLAYVVIADSNGSDVLEVSCPDLEDARLLAAKLWSPWDPPHTLPPGVANDGEMSDFNVTLTYPNGWYLADRSLTPHLSSPTEILSLGSFPLRPGGPNCAQIPSQALHDMDASDVFVTLQELSGADPSGFEPRPDNFGPTPESTENVFYGCLEPEERSDVGAIHWLSFTDQDRYFYVLVALGRDADPQQVSAIWGSLDRMVILPRE